MVTAATRRPTRTRLGPRLVLAAVAALASCTTGGGEAGTTHAPPAAGSLPGSLPDVVPGALGAEVGRIQPLPSGYEAGAEMFPARPFGRSWTYRFRGRDERVTEVVLDPAPLLAGGGGDPGPIGFRRFVMQKPGQPDTIIDGQLFRADAEGVSLLGRGYRLPDPDPSLRSKPGTPHRIDPPSLLLRFPFRTAATWDSGGKQMVVIGRADVETLAGSFDDCIVVEARAEGERPGELLREVRRFYAPGVGLVLAQSAAAAERWVAVQELEAYSTGEG